MKHITITISDIERLNSIKTQLATKEPLSSKEQEYRLAFLSQVPTPESELLKNVPFDETVEVNFWDINKLDAALAKWHNLFCNIPGFDFTPVVYVIDQNSDVKLLHKNVIMTTAFSPRLSHNEFIDSEAFEVHLKDDGTATFWFPTFEDAEQYPEMYNFKGTWKEAYLLLIETLQKGWPMEEFPEELQKFLPKQ